MTLLLEFVKAGDAGDPVYREQRAREFAQRCDDDALDRVVAFAPETPLGRAYRAACFLERDARRIADICSDAELDRILDLPDTPERAVYKNAGFIEWQARHFARLCDAAALRRIIDEVPSDRQERANRAACIVEAQRRSIIEAPACKLPTTVVSQDA